MSQDKYVGAAIPPAQAEDSSSPALPADVENAMFENVAPVRLPAGRSDAIKAHLMQRVRAERQPQLTTVQADQGDWMPFLPKVHIKHLHRDGDTLTYLLRLEPGAILVPHDHPQDEECIVLDGEVRIGRTVARTGAYHLAPKGLPHDAIVSDTGALLFLRGAVPDASQVRWASLGTLAALSPSPVRDFIRRYWPN